MEYAPLGDLEHNLQALLPETEACIITRQMLQGLVFMHKNRFAHRDLKPGVSTYYYISSRGYPDKGILEYPRLPRRA